MSNLYALPSTTLIGEVSLSTRPDAELLAKLSHSSAQRLSSIPIRWEGGRVIVAMLDPDDIFAIDELQQKLNATVIPQQCEAQLLKDLIEAGYRKSDEIHEIARALEQELADRTPKDDSLGELADEADDAPVMRLLENIFLDALELGTSDIHLEPEPKRFRIRQRVDGVLQEQKVENSAIFPALAIRLKLMSDLDIAEKRLPQEGRFSIRLLDQEIEIRIATMPTLHGESITLRLIIKSNHQRSLSHLGLSANQLEQIESILEDPSGMVLTVGPTGSGKSTSLTSMLNLLNATERKLFTIEDPIESQLSGATQVQVNPRIGLNFSDVLRGALRHDPDVIMLGEMRDRETAEISIRAAMTGHLVLSTMHCNDAQSALPRLMDMGIDPYLIAGALKAVIAQRLLRKVCKFCTSTIETNPIDKAWIEQLGVKAAEAYQFGKGCNQCNGTGYRGRVGVYELLVIDQETSSLKLKPAPGPSPKPQSARSSSLLMAALEKAAVGDTSLEEVKRVLGTTESRGNNEQL